MSPSPVSASAKPFRAHATGGSEPGPKPEWFDGGIFAKLSQEWTRLDGLPSMSRTLARWAKTEPVLLGCSSLGGLLDQIDAAGGDETDQLLLALLRLSHSGQQLAGRILLQAMLPKIARMVRSTSHSRNEDHNHDDRRHVAIAIFWEIVASYPVDRRTTGVAGNLALDTLHQLTADRRKSPGDIAVAPDRLSETLYNNLQINQAKTARPISGLTYELHSSTDGLSSDSDLLEVITWGVSAGVICSDEANLLIEVYLPSPANPAGPATRAGVAAGLSPAAVRQRCSRARRKLITAVQADLAGPAPLAQSA